MNVQAALSAALESAGLSTKVNSQSDLSGGCIHRVARLLLDDGTTVIAKWNRSQAIGMFREESRSLEALAKTNTVAVPAPLAALEHAGTAVLLMTEIVRASASSDGWQQFGRDLAALHAAPAGDRYGWAYDNHIGSTHQANAWNDDWVSFNAVNRLGFQLAMARDNGLIDEPESLLIERVIERLDQFIPRKPRPSLLHGDLWSGNVLPARIARGASSIATCAVIDPACSIGHALADIAMMQLFGGFPEVCFKAYDEASGVRLREESSAAAIRVYQLYHVLNHVNLFGRGYVDQAMSIARRLGA